MSAAIVKSAASRQLIPLTTATHDESAGGDAGGMLRCVGDLEIRVGDLRFTARWEEAAPLTRDALRAWLPIRSKLIHCRWSGESTWIPFGDQRPAVGFENHTSHPSPGHLLIYTGDVSE